MLLDEHISSDGVARPLRERGHDVLAIVEHREYWGMSDDGIVELAIAQKRITVTFDLADYSGILAQAASSEGHCGAIFISSKVAAQSHFGKVIKGIEDALKTWPDQDGWRNRIHWLKAH